MPLQIGLPQPLAGSQPVAAEKPLLHSKSVSPLVMSSKATPGCCCIVCHSLGPRGPRGLRPALRRWSVMREKMPAIMGEDCDVPSDEIEAMSGYARPVTL